MIIIGGKKEVSLQKEPKFLKFNPCELSTYKELVEKEEDIALVVSDIKELIYACNIGVKYAVTNKEDAAIMQKIVDSYLFDTKLLAIIYEEDEIEWAAVAEIDGVVFDEEEKL